MTEDIFAAAIAELHGGGSISHNLNASVPAWKRAKLGDRVLMADDWTYPDLVYRGGVGTVAYLNDEKGHPRNSYKDPPSRLGLRMPGVTTGYAWAKNTHVLGIVGEDSDG